MGLIDIARTVSHVPLLLKLKKGMVPKPLAAKDCIGARVEDKAARFGARTAIIFEGREINWTQFNALANQYAHYLKAEGVTRGDTVSVMLENRIEFLALVIALNKIGATAALINTNLHGRPLTHCITVTQSKKCVFGSEVTPAMDEVKAELGMTEGSDYYVIPDEGAAALPPWAKDLSALSRDFATDNPPDTRECSLGETAFYVFTSGTTGLPKAAVLSNRRYLQSADLSGIAGLRCTEQDRLYLCLPLYHGTGLLIGAGSAFTTGASMFVRRKFSASNFLREVREYGCTCVVYIGELCRYLNNTPAHPDDHKNPIRAMMGNGLRPDVWMEFKQRFGVKRICEFYGASEGNVSFVNLLNKNCTVGMTAAQVSLVQYDIHNDQIVRDANGRCIEVSGGEPGLMLGKITENTVFEGYTDPEATQKKIVRDVYEPGDAWFNSGDLMRTVDVGYALGYDHYQFVDRVGDTFRWKSENVSTNEVGEIINRFDQIKFSNVYGVEIPGTDGRAGMAALILQDGVETLDLDRLAKYLHHELPSYAVPVFLRVQRDIDVTGTFKMVKGDLREQAYDISLFDDPVFVMRHGEQTYTALDAQYVEALRKGEAGF